METSELSLLLEAIKQCYGWDFTHYKLASLRRRIQQLLDKLKLQHVSQLIPLVYHDQQFFREFIKTLSVPVSEMFRDPEVYLLIKEKIFPILSTYPTISIWHAGCATGKEVYSLAILLQEADLYHRCEIYATDINPDAINQAQQGLYHEEDVRQYQKNYYRAGGKENLLRYFSFENSSATIAEFLKTNIHFFQHNLVHDQSFEKHHLVLCRNVFIYFDRNLQNHVLNILSESLYQGGFLCLGLKESLTHLDQAENFTMLQQPLPVYKRGYQ